jgi:archaellum component FlaC
VAARRKQSGGSELTTQILVQIRDEMPSMRSELNGVRAELNGVRADLHRLEERQSEDVRRLEARQTEDGIRLATEVVAVARAIGEVRDLLRDQRLDARKLEDHETRISRIERKIA